MESQITVGEAAKRAGVSAKAVRLYEARGILPTASRTVSGYRLYSDDDVQLLRWVRGARSLGLTLAEIGRILDLRREGRQPCERMTEMLESHVKSIDNAVTDLRALQEVLRGMLNESEQRRSRGEAVGYCDVVRGAGAPPPHPGDSPRSGGSSRPSRHRDAFVSGPAND